MPPNVPEAVLPSNQSPTLLEDWLAVLRGPYGTALLEHPHFAATHAQFVAMEWYLASPAHRVLPETLESRLRPNDPNSPSCLQALYRAGVLSVGTLMAWVAQGWVHSSAEAVVPWLKGYRLHDVPDAHGRMATLCRGVHEDKTPQPWTQAGLELMRWDPDTQTYRMPASMAQLLFFSLHGTEDMIGLGLCHWMEPTTQEWLNRVGRRTWSHSTLDAPMAWPRAIETGTQPAWRSPLLPSEEPDVGELVRDRAMARWLAQDPTPQRLRQCTQWPLTRGLHPNTHGWFEGSPQLWVDFQERLMRFMNRPRIAALQASRYRFEPLPLSQDDRSRAQEYLLEHLLTRRHSPAQPQLLERLMHLGWDLAPPTMADVEAIHTHPFGLLLSGAVAHPQQIEALLAVGERWRTSDVGQQWLETMQTHHHSTVLLTTLLHDLGHYGGVPTDAQFEALLDFCARCGEDITAVNPNNQYTPLHLYTWMLHHEVQPSFVPALLARGVDVHAQTEHGNTALQFAVANDHPAAVLDLLKAGAVWTRPCDHDEVSPRMRDLLHAWHSHQAMPEFLRTADGRLAERRRRL